jgi:hypothetical protein
MRCQRAMWNVDHLRSDLMRLAAGTRSLRRRSASRVLTDMLTVAEQAAWKVLERQFGGAEFEEPVLLLLSQLCDVVEHLGGPGEHGADFLCRSVDPFGLESRIGVQLKMWEGVADSTESLDQISEAAGRWRLTGAIVLMTATSTSRDFDLAANSLAGKLRIPVRVICRAELMRHMLRHIVREPPEPRHLIK